MINPQQSPAPNHTRRLVEFEEPLLGVVAFHEITWTERRCWGPLFCGTPKDSYVGNDLSTLFSSWRFLLYIYKYIYIIYLYDYISVFLVTAVCVCWLNWKFRNTIGSCSMLRLLRLLRHERNRAMCHVRWSSWSSHFMEIHGHHGVYINPHRTWIGKMQKRGDKKKCRCPAEKSWCFLHTLMFTAGQIYTSLALVGKGKWENWAMKKLVVNSRSKTSHQVSENCKYWRASSIFRNTHMS